MRSTSLMFSMPTSHAEAIKSTPGVRDVDLGELVRRHLQGSAELLRPVRHRPRELPADVSRDPADAGGAPGVPRRPHRLHRRRRPGEAVRLQGRRQDHAAGRHPGLRHRGLRLHRSAASTTSGGTAVDNQSMLFHWKYADERSLDEGQVGWYVARDRQPRQAAAGLGRDRPASSRTRRTRPRPTPSRRFRARSSRCSAI